MCKSKMGPKSGQTSLSLKKKKNAHRQKARQFEISPKKSPTTTPSPSSPLRLLSFSSSPIFHSFTSPLFISLPFTSTGGPCNFKELCQIFITGFIGSVKSLLVSPQEGVMRPRQRGGDGGREGEGRRRERRVISEQLLARCV